MAKKKDFANVVDESFQEGYQSEPDVVSHEDAPVPEERAVAQERAQVISQTTKETFFSTLEKKGFDEAVKVLSPAEKEILAQRIEAGDEEFVSKIIRREDRSTYYLTDLQRACIDVVAHKEGIKKNDVITTALNRHFSDEVKAEARELVVSRAIKKLKKA